MKQSGVTLLELLVTLTILTILASVALPFTKVSTKRTKEIELRQNLRVIRAAIDAFRLEWARDGDTLIGPACVKNRLSCKDVTGPYGYPKSLDALLGVKLTGEQATVRGTTIRRYLRSIPLDPMTGEANWRLRCYRDPASVKDWCGEDIYDVTTQSQELALDGSKYREW
ncbi:MAG: prepilin-type N-terminal cleavage/methylation domain-containing protein [Nitrospira sp.]